MEKGKLSDFLGKTDDISLARSLRLAVTRGFYLQGRISETDAKEVLAGPLSPGDETTVYDDSDLLNALEGEEA